MPGMADDGGQRTELVEAMLEPGFYPDAPPSVDLRDTHISWVFLAGERAFKVKKPVVFPFLDYGSLERRHQMCREEIRLNRRLAPELYLRVVGVARRGDRYSLTAEDDPAAIEYAVEMRRVEEDRSLAALALRGELGPAEVTAVARRLARFHAAAPAAPPEARAVALLVVTLNENLATLRGAGLEIIGDLRLSAAERFTRAFVSARRDELERRARAGLVRDCHGDLRAEHVIVPARGGVYVYDCVEFNPDLRRIDVAADMAFLVMDLARLGAESSAWQLIETYRRDGGDPGDDPLLSFLASYRAWVRSKVACLRALELEPGDPERGRAEAQARELIGLGHRFAWRARRPLALVVCGVAGTGKTTLARELAAVSGWDHLSSDVTRKRLAGIAPTERAREEHYSREFTRRTYRELGRLAREELASRHGVIVDATCHRRTERAAFRAELGESAARLLFVECRASPDVLEARLHARETELGRVSDADATVARRQLRDLEPLDEVPAGTSTQLPADAPPEELVAAVERFIDSAATRYG